MITLSVYAATAILTLAILCGLVRLACGPTVIDRIMSFDLITTSAVGMIVLLSIQWRTSLYLELILIFSLLGFFGTVAFVYYLSRTQDLERTTPGDEGGQNGSSPSPAPSNHD